VSNPVAHFEILGPDGVALQQFYRRLFGWQLPDAQPVRLAALRPAAGW